jgi:hypothetical protein
MVEPIPHRLKYLTEASVQGNSSVSLIDSISLYNSNGKYPISFGVVSTDPKGDGVRGVFREPTPGCVQILYTPAFTPQYYITGHSLGDTVLDVLIDYSKAIDLQYAEGNPDRQGLLYSPQNVQIQDNLLERLGSPSKSDDLLKLLALNPGMVTVPHRCLFTDETKEQLAERVGFDLSYFVEHKVGFFIDSSHGPFPGKLDERLQEGLLEACPELPFALTDTKLALDKDGGPVYSIAAIALIRK